VQTDISHPKITEVANKGPTSSGKCEAESPECPLKGYDSHNGHGLEDHSKRRLSTSHATVKQTNTGHDQEDHTAEDDLVDVFPFKADVGRIDVHLLWVAAIGDGRVELRL
jgi:hypothetical protein